MRLRHMLVSTLMIASLGLLPGCGAATVAPMVGATSAKSMQAMSAYPIEEIQGIGSTYGRKLRKLGVTNHVSLQEATASLEMIQQLANDLGVPYKVVQSWAQQVDLMQVHGIGPRGASLLVAIEVTSMAKLAAADPAGLTERIGIANAFEPRFLERNPGLETVADWINQAKEQVAQREAEKKSNVLETTYDLNPIMVKRLAQAGIIDAAGLEAALATKQGREKVAKDSGLPYNWVLGLAQKLQIMKIQGIGLGEAKLLAAVGVTSVRKLAGWLPSDLQYRMSLANASEPRFVEKTPTEAAATAWVMAARKLVSSLDDR